MVSQRKGLSAGYGLGSWLQQRVTALIMLAGIIALCVFVVLACNNVNGSYASWQGFFNLMFVRIFVQILVLAVVIHAWVGIRDLWMDYVKSVSLRLGLYILTLLWLVASIIYSVKILWL